MRSQATFLPGKPVIVLSPAANDRQSVGLTEILNALSQRDHVKSAAVVKRKKLHNNKLFVNNMGNNIFI